MKKMNERYFCLAVFMSGIKNYLANKPLLSIPTKCNQMAEKKKGPFMGPF